MVRGRGSNVVDGRDSWRADPGTDDSALVPRGHHDLWGLGWPLHISCGGIVPVWGGCRVFFRNSFTATYERGTSPPVALQRVSLLASRLRTSPMTKLQVVAVVLH